MAVQWCGRGVALHDGVGIWLAARRLHTAKFAWPKDVTGTMTLTREQLDALVLGLPWQPHRRLAAAPLDGAEDQRVSGRRYSDRWMVNALESRETLADLSQEATSWAKASASKSLGLRLLSETRRIADTKAAL